MKFEAKITKMDLFKFLLYYNYARFSGVLSFLLGIFGFVGGVYYVATGNNTGILLLVVGLLLCVVQPILLYLKAVKQANLPVIKNGATYEFTEDGVVVSQGENKAELPWDKVTKWVSFQNEFFMFIDELRANVIPKNCLNGQEEKVMELVRRKLPAAKVKGK